ncbi:hypothetical protein BGW80DRAFT_169645 [Lactifluus volemus]|nr:hypothetical protein BGW80DRAFT_169645 [Lactifluus volemus]
MESHNWISFHKMHLILEQLSQDAPGTENSTSCKMFPPEQHPSPHDRPPVHIHPSEFTAASFNAGPYQTIGMPCDGQNQPGRTPPSSVPGHRPLVDSPSPSDLSNLTLEASGNHGVTPTAEGSSSGTNSVGAGIMPELRHGAMALPVHHNLSHSQPMAQVQQHAPAASPIALKQRVVKRIRPPPKVLCPKCDAGFHAPKALKRHEEDCHSEKKNCDYPGCDYTYIGKRKLEVHLQKRHGKAPRRRATRTQGSTLASIVTVLNREAPDSQTCSPASQLTEPESMSGLEFPFLDVFAT